MRTIDDRAPRPGIPVALEGSDALPKEIATSWWRSQMMGIQPEIAIEAVRTEELLDSDERLRRSVAPILDELATNLAGTNSSIVLADHRPVILDRRGMTKSIMSELDRNAILPGFDFSEGSVGTNAIGTAVEERRLVRVAGREHYANIFKHLSCFGVPLVHPLTRRLIGVLDLTFPPDEEHPLMPFYMKEAARRIQDILAEWASMRQRAQFECFVNLGKRGHRAVLSTLDDAVLLNRGARDLNPVDQAAILRMGNEATDVTHGTVMNVELGDGVPISVKVHTEADNVRFAGVVLEVLPGATAKRVATRGGPKPLPGLVGTSDAWRALCEQARRVPDATAPVLLCGEAGTGKLAVARALHAESGRPQLTVLDVASVVVDGQEQWLRALRDAFTGGDTVIVRHLHLCDATLAAAVAAEIDAANPGTRLLGTVTPPQTQEPALGSLLHRFSLRLEVPPVRDRRDDVEALVSCFVHRRAADRSTRFHPDALAALRSAEFGDNARELEGLVTGLVTTRRGDIRAADLPRLTKQGPAHLTAMEMAERDVIVKVLRELKGNKAAAASRLGISRPTLYRKLGIYGIDVVE